MIRLPTATCCLKTLPVNSMPRPSPKSFVDEDGNTVRSCSKCGFVKKLTKYFPTKTGVSHAHCKSCHAKENSKGYYKNLEKSREKHRGYAEKAKASKVIFVNDLKAKTPCADCHTCFPPICMDFDHLPNCKKFLDVSILVNRSGYSLEQVIEEIAKCELVCANCHRIRTTNRPRYRKDINDHRNPLGELRKGH